MKSQVSFYQCKKREKYERRKTSYSLVLIATSGKRLKKVAKRKELEMVELNFSEGFQVIVK